jgi:acetolactate synthase II small subunit
MTAHFEIHLKAAEGALLRTLGLVQRRGFRVTEMALRGDGDGQILTLSVDGQGRCPDLLGRQIQRLHDVASIERIEHEPWQATVADCVRALANLVPSGDPWRAASSEMRS